MTRLSLVLTTILVMACTSRTPDEPAEHAPRNQAERSVGTEPSTLPDRPQTDPMPCEDVYISPFPAGPTSEQATLAGVPWLTEEQRRRAVISLDGRWIAIPCDDVGAIQPEPNR